MSISQASCNLRGGHFEIEILKIKLVERYTRVRLKSVKNEILPTLVGLELRD